MPISSQLHNVDFELKDWRQSGLNVACGIKSQLATVEDRLVVKLLGRLSPRDLGELEQRLRQWLAI